METADKVQRAMMGGVKGLPKSGDAPRTERTGDSGGDVPTEQFPKLKGVPDPFDRMEERWQPSGDFQQTQQERYYTDKGDRKPIQRRIPIGPGGDGCCIGSSLKDSCLAK